MHKYANVSAAVPAQKTMPITVDIQKKLQSLNLQIKWSSSARRIAILGASGAGKSMTLKMIAGIETPDRGKIIADGRTLFDSDRKINMRTQERGTGYLFQNYALFPNMTVEQNIGIACRAARSERAALVQNLICRFGLKGLEHRHPDSLSGGQQQRAALARILAAAPDMILLDEPFSALDSSLRDKMQLELEKNLADFPGTVILVTHSRDEAYRFAQETVILENGHVAAAGPTKEVFRHPHTAAAARITGCKNIARAQRQDDFTVAVPEWGVLLHSDEKLPQHFEAVGYRAHDFAPVWDELPIEMRRDCISYNEDARAELQFEKIFYFYPDTAAAVGPAQGKARPAARALLTWMLQREDWPLLEEKGMPRYLRLDVSKALFLREEDGERNEP